MISRLVIDSTDAKTDLCELGKVCGTDKSPYNTVRHRHPYTAVYSMILAPLMLKQVKMRDHPWHAKFAVPAATSSCVLDL
jgi:hypothetical protein